MQLARRHHHKGKGLDRTHLKEPGNSSETATVPPPEADSSFWRTKLPQKGPFPQPSPQHTLTRAVSCWASERRLLQPGLPIRSSRSLHPARKHQMPFLNRSGGKKTQKIREIKQYYIQAPLVQWNILQEKQLCVSICWGWIWGSVCLCPFICCTEGPFPARSTSCFLSWRAEAAKLKDVVSFFGKRRSLVGAWKGLRLHDEGGRRSRAASFPDDTNSQGVRFSI